MDTKVNLDNLKVGDVIKMADGTVAVVSKVDPIPEDDSEFLRFGNRYLVYFLTEDGLEDHWWYRTDGTGNALRDEQIVKIIPKADDDKLSYEEVIEELVIEADALEKDLEEAYVMIDRLDMELDELKIEAANWKRTAKALHKAYLEQVETNKAKQDELDFQSEQLEELLGSESEEEVSTKVFQVSLPPSADPNGKLGGEFPVCFVSIEEIEGTEDELYDPFLADRYS